MATKSLIDWLRYWSVHVCSRLKLDLLRLNSAFRHHVKSHKRLCKTLTPHISVIFLFLRESLRLQLIATCRHTFADGQTVSQAPLPPGGHITTFPAHRTADESRCEVGSVRVGNKESKLSRSSSSTCNNRDVFQNLRCLSASSQSIKHQAVEIKARWKFLFRENTYGRHTVNENGSAPCAGMTHLSLKEQFTPKSKIHTRPLTCRSVYHQIVFGDVSILSAVSELDDTSLLQFKAPIFEKLVSNISSQKSCPGFSQ